MESVKIARCFRLMVQYVAYYKFDQVKNKFYEILVTLQKMMKVNEITLQYIITSFCC